MKRAAPLLLVAACGGAATAPATPVGEHAAPVALCVALDASAGPALPLPTDDASFRDDDEMLGAVDIVEVVQRPMDRDLPYAVTAVPDCVMSAKTCDVTLVRFDTRGRIAARRRLPGHDSAGMGWLPATVDAATLIDADGDGALDLVVRTIAAGMPEPAVGSTSTTTLWLLDPETLDIRLEIETDRTPEAGALPSCTSTVTRADVTCDGIEDVVVRRACLPSWCEEDPEGAAEVDPTMCAPVPDELTAYAGTGPGGVYERIAN